jgi:HSP20 family protein
MANLTRWNPFKTLTRFDPATLPFDDLFHGLGVRPAWREFDVAPDVRIDVSEDDKAYRVKAEIPGVSKNDIEISVEGNQVAISAEVKRETKKKDDEKEIYTERYFGKVYRSFSLPHDLESGKADAHYENGVLMLTLPKKTNGGSKRIMIS